MSRLISMTRDGRYVVLRRPGGLEVIDVQGVAPRRHVEASGDAAFACVGAELWIAGGALRRARLGRGEAALAVELPAGERITQVSPGSGPDAVGVLASGRRAWWIEAGAVVAVRELDEGWRWFALHGRRIVAARRDRAELRTVGRAGAIALPEPGGELGAAVALFGGRALAMWVRGGRSDALMVATPAGALVHRLTTPRLDACAFAESAGLAIAAAGDELWVIDLRYGRVRTSGPAPHAVVELAADAEARCVVLAGPPGDEAPATVSLVTGGDLAWRRGAADGDDHAPADRREYPGSAA